MNPSIEYAVLLALLVFNLVFAWDTTRALQVNRNDLLHNPTPIAFGALIAGIILLLMRAS